jgi:hypothetical protein
VKKLEGKDQQEQQDVELLAETGYFKHPNYCEEAGCPDLWSDLSSGRLFFSGKCCY